MGNRSSTPNARGGRTVVRLPGFHVKGVICIPKGQSHDLWLLAWIEQLLAGRTLRDLIANPPWPVPGDPHVSRQLVRELIDSRWAIPDWSGTGATVSAHLVEAYRREGRVGLARSLFDAEVLPGEWWMDAFGGALLSRQTSVQFDWDLHRRADVVLQAASDPQGLLDGYEPDLGDLVAKLGASQRVWEARDRAFLAAPLAAGTRKDVVFTLYGDDVRVLPDELAELEPVLARHAPKLFGERNAVRSRVVRLIRSRVEQIGAEIERLPSDPVRVGPVAPARARVERIAEVIGKNSGELEAWLAKGQLVRPVVGPTQRHFDALAEVCAAVGRDDGWVLLTSAFLNEQNLGEPDGLLEALEEAPSRTRFLLIYGHASDDIPAEQQNDMAGWLTALRDRSPSVAERVVLVAGKRRSHEKVIVTSSGDWIVGSWNPASSRPNATVFECSVSGRSPDFARSLVERITGNVEGAAGTSAVAELQAQLACKAPDAVGAERRREAVGTLRRAIDALVKALPAEGDAAPAAWTACVRALRGAWQPFLVTAHVELIDEQQTRDAFLAQVRSARRDVLLASDRLADSALDGATLRDLRGDGRTRPVVRVVWGREWAGRSPTEHHARAQLRRGRDTIREARELLGPALCTSEEPMENHAKVLLVDGLRGLVTSENLLSYGGEKGRYESRELGIAFSSPVLARHLLGRFLLHWTEDLTSVERRAAEPPLAWIVAAHEAWHALAPMANELAFDWRAPTYLGAVVRDDLAQAHDDRTRPAALDELERRLGADPFPWLREEAERQGLARVGDAWRPYDSPGPVTPEDLLAVAEREVLAARRPEDASARSPLARAPARDDPLVARVLADMRRIPAGRFRMGDDRVRGESPCHDVVISRPFLLGRTPVTQWLWSEVMGSLPFLRDVERHPEFPIIQVDYGEIRRFVEKLNARAGRQRFELPTEAQWEYACRAGSGATYCFGDDPGGGDRPGPLERYAWTKRNAAGRLQRVGSLQANVWGLHDMHGLVYETVRDGFRLYTGREVTDPIGPLDGRRVVARGGAWGRFPLDRRGSRDGEHFRCASRQVHEKSHRVSFRIMSTVEDEA